MKYSNLPFILTCIVCLLSSCTSKPEAQTSIPGITHADVYGKLPEKGFEMSETRTAQLLQTTLTSHVRGIDFDVLIYGPDADAVDSAFVEIQADSTFSDMRALVLVLLEVAQAPYDESKPGTVEQWIRDNYDKPESSTVIGPVEYTLLAPTYHSRRMTMRRAAGLSVFGTEVR